MPSFAWRIILHKNGALSPKNVGETYLIDVLISNYAFGWYNEKMYASQQLFFFFLR